MCAWMPVPRMTNKRYYSTCYNFCYLFTIAVAAADEGGRSARYRHTSVSPIETHVLRQFICICYRLTDKLDTRTEEDCRQLLQISWPWGSASSIFRGRWKGQSTGNIQFIGSKHTRKRVLYEFLKHMGVGGEGSCRLLWYTQSNQTNDSRLIRRVSRDLLGGC